LKIFLRLLYFSFRFISVSVGETFVFVIFLCSEMCASLCEKRFKTFIIAIVSIFRKKWQATYSGCLPVEERNEEESVV